jgi:hypothetical protein
MTAKSRTRLNWAAFGIALLALDGASLLGAQQTWIWLSNGEGAALVRAGRRVAEQTYTRAVGHVARTASDLALRAVEQTTGVYALMDSVTPQAKVSVAPRTICRVARIRMVGLDGVVRTHLTCRRGGV